MKHRRPELFRNVLPRDFPGGHAGASLKHPYQGAINARGYADFPGGHAGASLKQRPAVHRGDTGGGFPRRTRRGLIEARIAA